MFVGGAAFGCQEVVVPVSLVEMWAFYEGEVGAREDCFGWADELFGRGVVLLEADALGVGIGG